MYIISASNTYINCWTGFTPIQENEKYQHIDDDDDDDDDYVD